MKLKSCLSIALMLVCLFNFFYLCNSACSSTLVDTSINLSTNGDFESPNLGGGYRFTTDPLNGWISLTGKIQQGRGTIYNSRWTSQVIELETDRLDTYIQTVTLQQSTTLQLTISYAAREGISLASSGIKILWNGVAIRTVNPSINYLIHTQTFTLQGNQGQNQLGLQAMGIDDGAGMTADNIIFNIIQNTNRVVVNGVCLCETGYFDDHIHTACQPCSSIQSPCLTCDYNLNASNVYQFTCLTCQTGYFIQNGTCTVCTAVIAACTSCNIPGTVCYSCNQSINYFLNPDYSNSSSIQCKLCTLAGCITCSSLTACTTCNNSANYFLNNSSTCQLCSLPGCITCSSLTVCTTCNNSLNYFRNSSNVCQLCSLPGCISCSSLTQCTSRNCSIYSYAIGQDLSNRNRCICQTKFIWDPTLLKCVIQCNQINHALGTVANSSDSCNCPQKYLWNSSVLQCVIQCNQIRNALSLSSSAFDQCICQQMYGWRSSLECIFECSNILYTNGLRQVSENECNCISNFIWDYTVLKCYIDCGSISHALSLVDGSLNLCTCQQNFNWSPLTFCTINCSNIANTNGLVQNTNDQCYCKNDLVWASDFNVCMINCSDIENALQLQQDSLTECKCVKSYSWKKITKSCVLACEDIQYTLQLYTLPEDLVCPCMQNFIWNMTSKQCEYNCSSIENTNGEVQQGTSDVCICNKDFVWDEVDMICKAKEFDKLLASIVGIGVISTAALFNYLFIVLKKKLANLLINHIITEPSIQVIAG